MKRKEFKNILGVIYKSTLVLLYWFLFWGLFQRKIAGFSLAVRKKKKAQRCSAVSYKTLLQRIRATPCSISFRTISVSQKRANMQANTHAVSTYNHPP